MASKILQRRKEDKSLEARLEQLEDKIKKLEEKADKGNP